MYSLPSLFLYVCMHVCVCIYIYGGETPPGGYLLSKNFTFFLSFVVKMARKARTHTYVGVFMFPSFFFFLLSAFFCLSFSSLPLPFDILKPKKVPTRWGLLQPLAGPLETQPKNQFEAPKASKKVFFCRMEPLEWRFGVHKVPVRGPPKSAAKWDMYVDPELARLWAPSRLSNWSCWDYFIVSMILFQTPISKVFSFKPPLRYWNLGPNFRKNVWPLKTNLNRRRAVLWSLNRRSEWDPEIKQQKTHKKHKKTITTRNRMLFCYRKKHFRIKTKSWWPWVVGLSVAKDL